MASPLRRRRYATRPYAVFVAALYFATSAVFVFYGRSAARELSHVRVVSSLTAARACCCPRPHQACMREW